MDDDKHNSQTSNKQASLRVKLSSSWGKRVALALFLSAMIVALEVFWSIFFSKNSVFEGRADTSHAAPMYWVVLFFFALSLCIVVLDGMFATVRIIEIDAGNNIYLVNSSIIKKKENENRRSVERLYAKREASHAGPGWVMEVVKVFAVFPGEREECVWQGRNLPRGLNDVIEMGTLRT